MKSSCFSRWKMFVSSYLPLYVWLFYIAIDDKRKCGCEINGMQEMFYVLLCILIIISIIEIAQILKRDGSELKVLPEKMEIYPESDSLMGYFITYLPPLVLSDLLDERMIIMTAMIFIIVGIMYVSSSATYLNPVLGLIGFKVFGVTGFPHAHHIISKLSFDELEAARQKKEEVSQYRLGEGVYIVG